MCHSGWKLQESMPCPLSTATVTVNTQAEAAPSAQVDVEDRHRGREPWATQWRFRAGTETFVLKCGGSEV